jgi:cytochrome c-type biogenesis protein CcmF
VFVCAAAVVLFGTVLPLATEAFLGQQQAVGPPFFNRVFAPIAALLLLLSSFGTVVAWNRGSLARVAARLAWPAATATLVAAAVLVVSRRGSFAGVVWLAILLAATSVAEIARAVRSRGARDAFASNPRRYGGYVVHLGVALMVIGFAGSLGRTQTEVIATPKDTFAFAGYTFTYERLDRSSAPDKDVNLAVVELARGGRTVGTLRPQLNFHRNWDQPQSEIAIRTSPTRDVYVILAGIDDATGEAIFRIHDNPLVVWVWAGAAVALLGGLAALLVRPRRARSEPEPAGVAEPAPTSVAPAND